MLPIIDADMPAPIIEPEESNAEPAHVPVTAADPDGVDGPDREDGDDGDDARRTRRARARRRGSRRLRGYAW